MLVIKIIMLPKYLQRGKKAYKYKEIEKADLPWFTVQEGACFRGSLVLFNVQLIYLWAMPHS